jgi:hypothetical protein
MNESYTKAQGRRGGHSTTGILGLLILAVTLAGCQLSPAAPTAVATAALAEATAVVTPTVAARPAPTPTTRGAAATAAPGGGTPGAPMTGAVCAFAPPLAGASGIPAATPGATPTVSGAPGPPAAPAQVPPTIPLPALSAHYTMTVDGVDFDAGRLHTSETVAITNNEGCALDRLSFSVVAARWGWFALDGVRVAGQPVAATVTGTVLPVPLAQPLAPGATVEVALDFRLAVGTANDTYTGNGFAGTTRANDILRFAYWFPVLSDDHQYPPYLDPPYTATASYAVTMTTPADLVVAPTGEITDETTNADGTVTRRIAADNVRDFVFALSPNYRVARRQSATGTQIEVYYSPNSFRGNAARPETIQLLVEKALAAATLAEERLSELIGPYPYPTLRVVDGGAVLGGGIEFPTLIMVNLNYGSDSLIYHEVGHEWLYGLIGTRAQQDPWIDEGGASFLAAYIEGTLDPNPPDRTEFSYPLDTSVWAIPASGSQSAATEAIYTQGEAFYTRVFYAMGEEAFWRAMQALYGAERYKIITPRDLLAAWQAASPTDLHPLFHEYLSYPWIDELTR